MDYDSNSSEIINDSTPGELSEIHVSVDASDETGDGSSQNPFKSLECAVNNGKNNSIIYLNDGEYVGENNRNIVINKSITIIGESKQDTIINAESCGRLFNVTSTVKLTLINITLLNGYSAGEGGLIYNNGGEINIKNCILKNSTVDKNGGVIYNNLGTLNIENSCFTNNKAFRYGGVLYTLGTTSIKNSNFTENVLTSESGVGACIAAGGKIDLDGCLFYKCFTPYSAAALLSLGNATINNCRFERLSTNYTAGAISNHNYMVINNSYFGYNDVKYYAGAILAPPSGQHVITKVYNTIFEKNHAGLHGAVSNNYPDAELYMQNCALLNNYIILNKYYGDIALDDNATVQYCWWGKNEINPYYYSPHSNEIEPEKINASRWLIMTFTSNNDVIYRNEVNQLTVSLRHYFDNETKEIYEYDDEFDLPLDVTFYTNLGNLATKKLVNGVATFDFNPKSGDSVVYAKINNQVLKIGNFQLRKTDIVVNDFETYYGSGSKLVIKLINENNIPISNQRLKVSLGGSVYTIKTDANGQAKLSTDGLTPNVYNTTVTYAGNENYLGSTKSVNVVVKKATPNLTVIVKTFDGMDKTENCSVTLKDGENNATKIVVATLKDENENVISGVKVKVVVGNLSKIAKTDVNGQVFMDISSLLPGEYNIGARSAVTDIYNEAKVKTTVIINKIDVTLTIPDVVVVGNSTGVVVATLKDGNENVISGVKVKIVVGNLSKIARTDANGQVSFDISSLEPGEYKVGARSAITDVYNEAKSYAKAIISEDKLDTTLTIPDVFTVYNGTENVAVATLKDAYGNILSGVKVKLAVGNLSKIARTDENGQISLDISSLEPGEYKISARSAVTDFYNGAKAYAKTIVYADKITPTMTIPNVEIQQDATGAVAAATLTDDNGNAIYGLKVKIVVGNLSKIARTDANGQVSLDISSLEPGEYKISARSAVADVFNEAKSKAKVTINAN